MLGRRLVTPRWAEYPVFMVISGATGKNGVGDLDLGAIRRLEKRGWSHIYLDKKMGTQQ